MSTSASSSIKLNADISQFSDLQDIMFQEDMNMPLLDESSLHRVCVVTTEDMPDNDSIVSHESEMFMSQHMINEAEKYLNNDNRSNCSSTRNSNFMIHKLTLKNSFGSSKSGRPKKTLTEKIKILSKQNRKLKAEINKLKRESIKRESSEKSINKQLKRKKLDGVADNENHKNEEFSWSCKLCKVSNLTKDQWDEHKESDKHKLNIDVEKGTDKLMLVEELNELGIDKRVKMFGTINCCGKVYEKMRTYLTHYRKTHSFRKPFNCVHCKMNFFRKCDLQQHLKSHEIYRGLKAYKCTECKMSFNQASKLEGHMISKHNKPDDRDRRYKCTACDYLFLSKSDVENHMKKHTTEYTCNICQAVFSSSNGLKKHRKSHTGEKPFKCTVCDYCATTKHALTCHMRKHTGEKPYMCKVEGCDFSTASKFNLKRHMVKHNEGKPFKCPYCPYAASDMSNLKKHIKKTKKHHGLNMFMCKSCQFSTDNPFEFVNHSKQCDIGITNRSIFSKINPFNENQLASADTNKSEVPTTISTNEIYGLHYDQQNSEQQDDIILYSQQQPNISNNQYEEVNVNSMDVSLYNAIRATCPEMQTSDNNNNFYNNEDMLTFIVNSDV